jgi:tRNA (adenine22-N1)-methyltransferase
MENGELRIQDNLLKDQYTSSLLKLSPRLQLIANKVPVGARVADIGTDHAYIPIYLISKGIAEYVIASDIRKGPVEKAAANIKKYGLMHKIDVRLGNGLEKVESGEVDTIIIAGMGGVLITEILSVSEPVLRNINKLILQPMIGHEEVRIWLSENGYKIVDEELASEGDKIYNVIVAEHGKEKIEKEIYHYIGKKLIEKKDPLLKKLLAIKINEMKKIIKQLQNNHSENALTRLADCQIRLKEYESINCLIG